MEYGLSLNFKELLFLECLLKDKINHTEKKKEAVVESKTILEKVKAIKLVCIKCGKKCKEVGELNKLGEKKEYCCNCYFHTNHRLKHTKGYGMDNYCKFCLARLGYKKIEKLKD